MKAVKQFEVLEEGCCRITLSTKKAFDPFMLTMMQKEQAALYCRSKPNSNTIFFYDICEKIAFITLLQKYEFNEKEACACLLRLFTEIQRLDQEYPLYLQSDSIYYDPLTQQFYFVILPIHEVQYENDFVALLNDIASHIQIKKGALYGCICDLMLQQIQDPRIAAEKLQLWRRQHSLRMDIRRWWISLKNNKARLKQNEQRLQEELIRLRFIQRSQQMEAQPSLNTHQSRRSSDTVVLFPDSACLRDERAVAYSLRDEVHIGRDPQNDIVIANATVSAHHAVLKREEQGMKLYDLGSSNGTRVNKKKLTKKQGVLLKNGDRISFANSHFTYEEDVG